MIEKKVGDTQVVLLTGSIIDETTDVIVNAANTGLWPGTGVCGVIHHAAGQVIFDECQAILVNQNRAEIKPGEAVLTSSGRLYPRIKAIIHAAGPDCRNAKEYQQREELLTQVYVNSLTLLIDSESRRRWTIPSLASQPLQSIAFPSISTGIFGYDVAEAASVAVQAVIQFIEAHPGKIQSVHFVCLTADKDPRTIAAYQHEFLTMRC